MKTNSAQISNYPSWLDRVEYPFESHFFNLQMGRMHYVDEGKGDPIVMVHGNPGWSFEFRDIIKSLSKTQRCIAIDQIGFGLSDKPYEWDYLPKSHAANLEKLLDSLKLDKITLIVNDWGGPIGLNYALKHPEKIKKIILLNTWLWSVKGDPHFEKFSGMMGGRVGRFFIKYFNLFGKMVVKKAVANKSNFSMKIHKHYYKHMETPKQRKGSYVFPKQIIGSSEWLNELWSKREVLKNIPTTIIWGMKDIAFKEKELLKWISNLNEPKVIKLENVGHYPQEESPQVLIEELSAKH
jgi:haloalkane dehalogenase